MSRPARLRAALRPGRVAGPVAKPRRGPGWPGDRAWAALGGSAFIAVDSALWAVSLFLAFVLRFDGTIPAEFDSAMPVLLGLFVPVKLAWNAWLRLYRVRWELVGLLEILDVWKAAAGAALTLAGALYLLRWVDVFKTFPRGVLALDCLLGAVLVTASRLGLRLLREVAFGRRGGADCTRVLLVGAGAAGGHIARSMRAGPAGRYRPVGFIDDDPAKHGTYIQGLRVLGGRDAISGAVRTLGAEEVVITMPSADAASVREIVRCARDAGVTRIRMLPSLNELLAGRVTVQDIRDVNLEDLLGRAPVRLDGSRVNAFLRGQTVLVTGAGGSIGRELAHQLARSDVQRLLLIDNNETALFNLETELGGKRTGPRVHTIVADVRDANKMYRLLGLWKPEIVYHAAAYKHVPLMEQHPDEAVRTNIAGTRALAEAAIAHDTRHFVLISTDKAVNPTSVMGATKRLAELLVRALNDRRATRFIAVRFGNVLGSRGSVLPLLQDQIRRGGPVTVTHPEMTRYFMSTREAVGLVLQASAAGEPHDVFMLDMGRPIRIVELARELIRLSGLEPDRDVPIVFTGVRPGERLHEQLETPEEPLLPTTLPGVSAVKINGDVDETTLRLLVRELERLAEAMDSTGIKTLLRQLPGLSARRPAWAEAVRPVEAAGLAVAVPGPVAALGNTVP